LFRRRVVFAFARRRHRRPLFLNEADPIALLAAAGRWRRRFEQFLLLLLLHDFAVDRQVALQVDFVDALPSNHEAGVAALGVGVGRCAVDQLKATGVTAAV